MFPRCISYIFAALLSSTLLLTPGSAQSANAAATAPATPPPCAEPQQKQLDFWVGEWNLTWPGNTAGETAHGTNTVK